MTTTDSIECLSNAIAARGIDADPASLTQLGRDARDLGVNAILVDVMVDDREPAPARVRAFARVSTRVFLALGDDAASHRDLALAC